MPNPLENIALLNPDRLRRKRAILLIEDNEDWASEIRRLLDVDGDYEIVHESDEAGAIQALRLRRFDLMLVDRNLDPGDGLALLAAMRSQGMLTPAILLTSMTEEQDIVDGLLAGGDDYVLKPPRGPELRARIAALLRRVDEGGKLIFGQVEFNFRYNLVRIDDAQIKLDQSQLNLFAWLAIQSPGSSTMAEMLIKLWNYNIIDWPDGIRRVFNPGGLVDTTVSRLRRSLRESQMLEDIIVSHEATMDDVDYAALSAIDVDKAKLARNLTRSWSINATALQSITFDTPQH